MEINFAMNIQFNSIHDGLSPFNKIDISPKIYILSSFTDLNVIKNLSVCMPFSKCLFTLSANSPPYWQR